MKELKLINTVHIGNQFITPIVYGECSTVNIYEWIDA